jgi:PhnB protein
MARKKKVSFIPKGYRSVTPYLACRGAAQALAFYRKAFGAAELMRMPAPGGKVGHAEIRIGDSRIMLADEHPEIGFLAPPSRGGTSVLLHVYVKDADAVVKRAVAAGAKLEQPVEDKFYGDRSGSVVDPFGHVWNLATHKEDLSPAEMKKRAAKMK